MKMKLYYAKSVDDKKTIQFEGKTLITNSPFLFEFVTKLVNEKNNYKGETIDMKDYKIMEVEIEGKINEGKINDEK